MWDEGVVRTWVTFFRGLSRWRTGDVGFAVVFGGKLGIEGTFERALSGDFYRFKRTFFEKSAGRTMMLGMGG